MSASPYSLAGFDKLKREEVDSFFTKEEFSNIITMLSNADDEKGLSTQTDIIEEESSQSSEDFDLEELPLDSSSDGYENGSLVDSDREYSSTVLIHKNEEDEENEEEILLTSNGLSDKKINKIVNEELENNDSHQGNYILGSVVSKFKNKFKTISKKDGDKKESLHAYQNSEIPFHYKTGDLINKIKR